MLKGGQCRGLHRGLQGLNPRWLGQHSGKYVGDIEKRSRQEDLLHALVLAFDYDEPDDHGTDRHGDVLGDTEQFHASGNAGKLGDDVAEVRDQNTEHHEKRNSQAVFFADQIAQALARNRAHAGAHLLHYDQGDRNRDHRP